MTTDWASTEFFLIQLELTKWNHWQPMIGWSQVENKRRNLVDQSGTMKSNPNIKWTVQIDMCPLSLSALIHPRIRTDIIGKLHCVRVNWFVLRKKNLLQFVFKMEKMDFSNYESLCVFVFSDRCIWKEYFSVWLTIWGDWVSFKLFIFDWIKIFDWSHQKNEKFWIIFFKLLW